jgi:SAM-dependent methyltransferase
VLDVSAREWSDVGLFDRVLMYGVIHYARDESEVERFLDRVLEALRPGGLALVGDVPLEDLRRDWPTITDDRHPTQARADSARWLMRAGTAPIPLTRRWKARYLFEHAVRARSRERSFTLPELPPNYTVTMTSRIIERWLSQHHEQLTHRWKLPAPGAPLVAARADLVLTWR